MKPTAVDGRLDDGSQALPEVWQSTPEDVAGPTVLPSVHEDEDAMTTASGDCIK